VKNESIVNDLWAVHLQQMGKTISSIDLGRRGLGKNLFWAVLAAFFMRASFIHVLQISNRFDFNSFKKIESISI